MQAFEDMGWTQANSASPDVSFQRDSTARILSLPESPTVYAIPIVLGAPSASTVSVPFTVNPSTGTPVEGVDYTITTPSPITFAPGDRIGYINIDIPVDSSLTETNETLIITLGSPTGGTLVTSGFAHQVSITITNVNRVEEWSLY